MTGGTRLHFHSMNHQSEVILLHGYLSLQVAGEV